MKLIGLTGGIASGKSTASDVLRELGAEILDADAVYHELLSPEEGEASPLARAISERFDGVLKPDGSLDRSALGGRVFRDPAELEALGDIAHPAVATEVARRAARLNAAGVEIAVYDVPLLYERGLECAMDGVIVIWVPRAVQIERLMARDNIDQTAAERKLATQMALDDKRDRATWLIDNSGSPAQTRQQVEELWQRITDT